MLLQNQGLGLHPEAPVRSVGGLHHVVEHLHLEVQRELADVMQLAGSTPERKRTG